MFKSVRNGCNRMFVDILGYSPLASVLKYPGQDEEERRWMSPLKKRMIYEKRKMYERLIIEGQSMNDTSSSCNECLGNFDDSVR